MRSMMCCDYRTIWWKNISQHLQVLISCCKLSFFSEALLNNSQFVNRKHAASGLHITVSVLQENHLLCITLVTAVLWAVHVCAGSSPGPAHDEGHDLGWHQHTCCTREALGHPLLPCYQLSQNGGYKTVGHLFLPCYQLSQNGGYKTLGHPHLPCYQLFKNGGYKTVGHPLLPGYQLSQNGGYETVGHPLQPYYQLFLNGGYKQFFPIQQPSQNNG